MRYPTEFYSFHTVSFTCPVPVPVTEITSAPAPFEYLIGLDGVVSFDLPTLSEDPCHPLDSVTVTEVSGVGGTDIPCKANTATLKIECEIGYPDVAAYEGKLLDFEVTMRGADGGAYLWEHTSVFSIKAVNACERALPISSTVAGVVYYVSSGPLVVTAPLFSDNVADNLGSPGVCAQNLVLHYQINSITPSFVTFVETPTHLEFTIDTLILADVGIHDVPLGCEYTAEWVEVASLLKIDVR